MGTPASKMSLGAVVLEQPQDDRRVTVDTIARKLGIGHSAVQEMIESLGYRKVCAHWVQKVQKYTKE
jgi:Mn-dependent DtxR family transcriptional regulator